MSSFHITLIPIVYSLCKKMTTSEQDFSIFMFFLSDVSMGKMQESRTESITGITTFSYKEMHLELHILLSISWHFNKLLLKPSHLHVCGGESATNYAASI